MIRSISALAFVSAALSASAQLVTIDEFASPVQSVSVNTTGGEASSYVAAPVLGGTRGIAIANVTSVFGRSSDLDVADGAFGSNGLGVKSYGGATYGSAGYESAESSVIVTNNDNSISLPGFTGWSFDWLGNDHDVELNVFATTWDGPSESNRFSLWSQVVPAGGARTIVLDSSDISLFNAANPLAFDTITFFVDSTGTPGSDWGVGKFSAAVPEPASMAVLGLGLAALKRRRKNG